MCTFNTRWIVASALACVLLILCAQTTQATWSIVITNRVTGEIAVGQATCLRNRDLRAGLAVVRVAKGAGVVQNSGDPDGSRRMLIND